MSLKTWFQPVRVPTFGSLALLALRAIGGTAFMIHGWEKIGNPFHWMGPESKYPGFLQFLAALSEFGGGLAWILGVLTPLASLGIAATMAVAVYTHMQVMKDPFVNLTGGTAYELPSLFLGIAIVLMSLGAGRFSLDRAIFGPRALHLKSNDYP